MNLFFCQVDGGNFGDDMNEWFWDELFPGYRDIARDTTLFGIGSILWRKNFAGKDKAVIMGSGSGYGVIPNELPEGIEVGFVRGPRTARLLNLEASLAITDPAVMVSRFQQFQNLKTTGEIVFIPHIGTAKLPLNWDRIANRAEITYLSPANDSNGVIQTLAGANLVLAESLHGAIIADTFRIPWVPVSISPAFNNHKWLDWAESLEMEISFEELLVGMKRTRQRVGQIKNAFIGRKRTGCEQKTIEAMPHGTHVAATFSEEDKNSARKWVLRLSSVIEAMLVHDLRRAKRMKGFLSSEAILKRRQSQILNRIDQIRDRLTA